MFQNRVLFYSFFYHSILTWFTIVYSPWASVDDHHNILIILIKVCSIVRVCPFVMHISFCWSDCCCLEMPTLFSMDWRALRDFENARVVLGSETERY